MSKIKTNFECWGIFREKEHSPERENDDESILISVAEKLKINHDFEIKLFLPSDLPDIPPHFPDLIFFMCEREAIIDRFEKWKKKGIIMVNDPAGVRNTLRHNTLKILSQADFFPKSYHMSTHHIPDKGIRNVWVKRTDYHAVNHEDVQYAQDRRSLISIIERFRKRNIHSVLIQDHVEGDLIKFYGVRDGSSKESYWFCWFYHKSQTLHKYPFNQDSLRQICEHSADIMGVDVYGGDVIISPTGQIFLIDLNAWPSFALFRQEASDHIARYIVQKVMLPIADNSHYPVWSIK